MQDDCIYQFASLENAKKIFTSKTLKFTRAADLNDPFECNLDRIRFDLTKMSDDFIEYDKRKKANAVAEFGENALSINWHDVYKGVLERKLLKARLCCFSMINNHPLLWSHYADKHRGVCLVFKYDLVNQLIRRNIKIGIEGQVTYKEFEKVNFCEGWEKAYKHLYAAKGVDWAYEQEYRMIAFDLDQEFVEFPDECLVGIIFGIKVKNAEIADFRKQFESEFPDIDIQVAIKHNEKLEVINWPGATINTQGLVIHVVSGNPSLAGLMERVFDK